jgi:hypothetical protein
MPIEHIMGINCFNNLVRNLMTDIPIFVAFIIFKSEVDFKFPFRFEF